MNEMIDDFSQLSMELDTIISESRFDEFEKPLKKLEQAAKQIEKSWSGSYLGYHSRVYYEKFQVPPPGANFSSEWGLMGSFLDGTTGNWKEFTYDYVHSKIFEMSGDPDLKNVRKLAQKARELFEAKRREINSILNNLSESQKDSFIENLQSEIEGMKIFLAKDFIKSSIPRIQIMTRDMVAAGQGFHTPPHLSVKGEVLGFRFAFQSCENLSKLVKQITNHLLRKERYSGKKTKMNNKKVFIGHGRSKNWKELKEFIQDRLKLDWDEFNRVSIAGITNITRLSQMLDEAGIAFLVLTAEDELSDGKMQARMNVIHEAGLFQGRLGFTKAIVLLEEGCEEFSNIQGIGQIRFPKDKIKEVFEDIRQVLEREGVLES